MNQTAMPYQERPRLADATIEQTGLFAEASYAPSDDSKIFGGVRIDNWKAEDQRQFLGMMHAPRPNPTIDERRDDYLTSAFLRYEYAINAHQWYAGIGRAERFPDFWELIGNQNISETSASSFHTAAELTHQLDLGYHFRKERVEWVLSSFYNRVDDFILIENGMMMNPDTVRAISAESWGGEAMVTYRPSDNWLLDASLAYTHGSNLTDARPLAQQPPLELKFGAEYKFQDWTFAGLWRVVDNQHRVAMGQGNIVGNDFKQTAGFGTLALNTHWRIANSWRMSFGIDNVLDKLYAEHLSTAGAMIAGFEQTTQVNEPGRTFWFKLDYHL